MRIAKTQLLFPYQPILSVSEFSAIAGSQAQQMVTNVGVFLWSGLMMLHGAWIQEEQKGFLTGDFDVSHLLITIGVCGLLMIGIFQLNQYDRGMILFHYIGAILSLAIMVAAIIQGVSLGGYHMICPITLTVAALSCLAYWFWISHPSQIRKFEQRLISCSEENSKSPRECLQEIRVKVNRFSVKCIVLEGIAIYCTALNLSFYLIQNDFHHHSLDA